MIKYVNLTPFKDCTTEIETKEHYYDLHNIADFLYTLYNTEKKSAELVWNYPSKWFLSDDSIFKDKEDFLKKNDISENVRLIALIFRNVTRYEVLPRDREMPFTEDNCLAQILTYDENFKEDVLYFEFQSGLKIIIECEELYFERDF